MDGDRFDHLTRLLARDRTRRAAIKTFAAGLVSAAAGVLNAGDVLGAVRCRKYSQVCRKGADCCSEVCGPPNRSGRGRCECSESADCPVPSNHCLAAVCTNGVCSTTNACTGEQICYRRSCCTPNAHEVTCTGKCGSVKNNCGQTIDCGPCCDPNGEDCSVNSDCCSGHCCAGTCAACCNALHCPGDDTDCSHRTCTGGVCGTASESAGAECDENGGRVCDGQGVCVACNQPSDCPGEDTICATRTCVEHVCGWSYAASGIFVSDSTAGDCIKIVCDGNGETMNVANTDDAPVPTGACWETSCNGTEPVSTPKAQGELCNESGGYVCDGSGNCVQCVINIECAVSCCDNVCIDTTWDASNCGGCGVTCDDQCCDGACVDTLSDHDHCGGCGACESYEVCCSGVCEDLNGSGQYCGQCGHYCEDFESCCSSVCVDPDFDEEHCGSCDISCTVGETCCGGTCIDAGSDLNNCGECGSTCAEGCENGSCCRTASSIDCSESCCSDYVKIDEGSYCLCYYLNA